MRIAIAGVGGVGGYYGGKLAHHYGGREDTEVIFVARGQHLEQIQRHGLRLVLPEGNLQATPAWATDRPQTLGTFDLTLFCVKGYDLEQTARIVADNLNAHSVVLPLLNGVDNAEILSSLLPTARVLNGCVYLSAQIEQPGVVRQIGGSGELFFGPETGDIEAFGHIESLLVSAGIKAKLRADIREVVWQKFMFIAPLASVTSIFKAPFGVVMESKESRTLLEGLMKELECLARAKGVDLPGDIVRRSLDRVSTFPYETKSSMQADLERGRKTEMETFAGYVVRAAKEAKLDVPLHKEVYSRLKPLCG